MPSSPSQSRTALPPTRKYRFARPVLSLQSARETCTEMCPQCSPARSPEIDSSTPVENSPNILLERWIQDGGRSLDHAAYVVDRLSPEAGDRRFAARQISHYAFSLDYVDVAVWGDTGEFVDTLTWRGPMDLKFVELSCGADP